MTNLLWGTGTAFLISLILTPIIRDIFRSYNIVDQPGTRKMHRYPIPRVGGIAIVCAYAVALATSPQLFPTTPGLDLTWKVAPGALVIFLTGLLDDFFDLKAVVKLGFQFIAAGLVFWGGVRLDSIAGTALPVWLQLPLTLFWLLLTTNAFNLIDGLDGLCAGIGLLSTLTLFTAAMLHGNLPLAYATLPLAGALLGFLGYNLNPATAFLGDSGALTLGFLLGCYGMAWTQKVDTLLALTVPVLALAVPLLDVSLSVFRRLVRNQPIFTADREHIHHRLVNHRGLHPRRAVLMLYLAAAVAAVFGGLLTITRLGNWTGLMMLMVCAAAWVGIRQLQYSEFGVLGRILFDGKFQRIISDKLRLAKLSAALEQADSEQQWWAALVDCARGSGFLRLRWDSGQWNREAVLAEGTPAWSLHIPLGNETISIEGIFRPTDTGLAMAFAGKVAASLSTKRRKWAQGAETTVRIED